MSLSLGKLYWDMKQFKQLCTILQKANIRFQLVLNFYELLIDFINPVSTFSLLVVGISQTWPIPWSTCTEDLSHRPLPSNQPGSVNSSFSPGHSNWIRAKTHTQIGPISQTIKKTSFFWMLDEKWGSAPQVILPAMWKKWGRRRKDKQAELQETVPRQHNLSGQM